MAKVECNGQVGSFTRGRGKVVNVMEKVSRHGPMAWFSLVRSTKVSCTAKADWLKRMVFSTKEPGTQAKWKVSRMILMRRHGKTKQLQ